jgi:integral membrane protein
MSFSSVLGWLRITGIVEGLSYLLLLIVAMPLKYYWGKPEMVSVVGMAHGVLFVLYLALSVLAREQYGWSWKKVLILWVASVVPLGTFYVDVKMLRHSAV